ncbi:MAG: creatininase family protein [Verrucomicrobiota bacterium]
MQDATYSPWSAMTWPEILERIDGGCDGVILPLGATEQHGPHLGTGMDSVLSEEVCRAAGKATGVPVLPTLPYGCSIGHSHRWPGTIALSPTTMIAVLCDMGDWLYKSGIRRCFLVNGHVGNQSAIGCALDTLRCRYDDMMVSNINTGNITPAIEATFSADADDWHGNAAETSLMMALSPKMVRMNELTSADDPDRTGECVFFHPVNRTSTNGVTGRPSESSEIAGKQLFQELVSALSKLVEKGLKEKPPLDASYDERV